MGNIKPCSIPIVTLFEECQEYLDAMRRERISDLLKSCGRPVSVIAASDDKATATAVAMQDASLTSNNETGGTR